MTTYELRNIITNEVYAKITVHTLAAAQEYFDIMFPYAINGVIFKLN